MREGLLGLLLYLTHWLAPEAERASIDARFVRFIDEQTVSFNCQMEIAWNKRLEQLVDAGIPLRFRIASFSDKSDTVLFYRSLFFDVVNYTYTFSDSGGGGSKIKSISAYSPRVKGFLPMGGEGSPGCCALPGRCSDFAK